MKIYTGVGSRRVPPHIAVIMRVLAYNLARAGWTLRSGGASGSDAAFESGAGRAKQIFRPEHVTPAALAMAAAVHPAWARCSAYARKLHARNCFQILGLKLDAPSAFVVCWTPDGATSESECSIETGGTATAIRLASRHQIPVFNLARADHLARVQRFLS